MKKCNKLRAAAVMAAGRRKKKIESGESKQSTSSARFKIRRLEWMRPENSRCESVSSDHVLTSCCSGDGSSEHIKESLKSVDLEENDVIVEFIQTSNDDWTDSSDDRQQTKLSSEILVQSGEIESTAPQEHESNSVAKKPSEAELEEFFVAAEKDLQKKFIEKYNYDIVKDEPLEGRYEWVEVKP